MGARGGGLSLTSPPPPPLTSLPPCISRHTPPFQHSPYFSLEVYKPYCPTVLPTAIVGGSAAINRITIPLQSESRMNLEDARAGWRPPLHPARHACDVDVIMPMWPSTTRPSPTRDPPPPPRAIFLL